MPTNDTIVSIPLVGGLNQQLDPDQLQPPELMVAENVVARRGGRLEKRPGYQLVETAAQTGAPAAAFGGSSGSVSPDVEAIGPYYGKDGARALVAAGSRLYEYVGYDATHGWRDVNKLPSYLGTLHSVVATGGSIIEVESRAINGNSSILTVWVTGTRSGKELASDSAYADQTSGDGNSVYYAVQDRITGAFIVPPVRVAGVAGGPAYVQSATNLRVTEISSAGASFYVIAWEKSGLDVEYFVLNATTFAVSPTVRPFIYIVQKVHRGFDAVGLPGSSVGHAVFAFCRPDTASSSTPAKLVAIAVSINTSTGIPTTISTVADALSQCMMAWDAMKPRRCCGLNETLPA